MKFAASIEDVPDPEGPFRSAGSGKVIRPGGYGHVEVTANPNFSTSEFAVEWKVVGGSIPVEERELVIAASRRVLDFAARQQRLRCGVLLTIERGSYHDSMLPAHGEAAELATMDALRRGHFLHQA